MKITEELVKTKKAVIVDKSKLKRSLKIESSKQSVWALGKSGHEGLFEQSSEL